MLLNGFTPNARRYDMKIKWVIFYEPKGPRTVSADSPDGRKYIEAVVLSLIKSLKRFGKWRPEHSCLYEYLGR